MVSGRAPAYIAIVYLRLADAMRVNVRLHERSLDDYLLSEVEGVTVEPAAPLVVADQELTEERLETHRAFSGDTVPKFDPHLAMPDTLEITPEAMGVVQDASLEEFLKLYSSENVSGSHDTGSWSNRASMNSSSPVRTDDDLQDLLDELFSGSESNTSTSAQIIEAPKSNPHKPLIPSLPPTFPPLPSSLFTPPISFLYPPSTPHPIDNLAEEQWLRFLRQQVLAEQTALAAAHASLPAESTPAKLLGLPSWNTSDRQAQQALTSLQQRRQQLEAEVNAIAARSVSLPVGSAPTEQPGLLANLSNSIKKPMQEPTPRQRDASLPPAEQPGSLAKSPSSTKNVTQPPVAPKLLLAWPSHAISKNKKRTWKDSQSNHVDFTKAMLEYESLGCGKTWSLKAMKASLLMECCVASHIWTICDLHTKKTLKNVEGFNKLYEEFASKSMPRQRVAKALYDNYGNDSFSRARTELEAEDRERKEGILQARANLRKDAKRDVELSEVPLPPLFSHLRASMH